MLIVALLLILAWLPDLIINRREPKTFTHHSSCGPLNLDMIEVTVSFLRSGSIVLHTDMVRPLHNVLF